MTPANQKDINLLPKDLTRSKSGVKHASSGSLVEYTSVSERAKKLEEKQKKPSLFSRLFSVFTREKKAEKPRLIVTSATLPQKQKKSAVQPDLPQGAPLPSALFADAKKAKPSSIVPPVSEPTAEPGVTALQVMSMHTPDFLSSEVQKPLEPAGSLVAPKQAAPTPVSIPAPTPVVSSTAPVPSVVAAQNKPHKISWWRTWFFKKKEQVAKITELQIPPKSTDTSTQQLLPKKESFVPKPVALPKPSAHGAPLPAASPSPVAIPAQKIVPPKASASSTASVVAQKATTSEQTEAPVHRLSTFDVNLLSAEYTQAFKKGNPYITLALWSFVAVLFVGVSYGVLALYEIRGASKLAQEEQVVAALVNTIGTYEDVQNEDTVLRSKVAASRELIGNHISWYAFLEKLEGVTIPEITYISMAASTKGIMSITAFAGDYTGLARQIVVFQQTQWIQDITVTSASRVEESPTQAAGVSFDMQLSISPAVLFSERYSYE
ncbi:hypothetical protein BK004_00070 [bacterium CG10_46_32]|nr:MAG: hypothetical protein BK004_00070 [bacterium CG10_46_32]PIR56519.1 MAG: hypothetical protein COU73_00070 [Parcubacteria group bacterium CG10_big_fil_rev_8_21_14_0_10_46_32]